ncbi:MAG: hypothetical protein M3530_02825 [Thermoproteota archaeon]|nr:hypothetical protein [Thermoproteota archaeon]
MGSKSKAKKTSSRITKKKGIKSSSRKNKNKVKQSVSVNTKRATRRRATSARRPKKLKTIRQTPQSRKTPSKKEIVVRRSSGRVEKFDTNRLAQTVSRSGVPFLMARDIAKKATKKIKSQIRSPVRKDNRMSKGTGKRTIPRGRKSSPKPESVVVTASQVRNLVADELQDRNRLDIASSYTGYPPEYHDLQAKPTLDDKEPVLDIVAANMNKVLHDPSKRKASA